MLEISQNSQENICARVSFLIKLLVFSHEFCKISKNNLFTERREFDIRMNKSASTAFRKVDNTKKNSEISLNRISVNENSYSK